MTRASKEIFKALGNDVRIKIVNLLFKKGELSCQDLQGHFTLSQPTMSHHLTKLIEAEIISIRKKGTNHFYTLNQKLLNQHGIYLDGRR